jgi:hypothetical protein
MATSWTRNQRVPLMSVPRSTGCAPSAALSLAIDEDVLVQDEPGSLTEEQKRELRSELRRRRNILWRLVSLFVLGTVAIALTASWALLAAYFAVAAVAVVAPVARQRQVERAATRYLG